MSKDLRDFVIKLGDKEFVQYEGLLDIAHKKGLKSIETQIIQIPHKENGNLAIVQATVTGMEVAVGNELVTKTFTGIGDASQASANRMMTHHILRLAETRAKARALRDFTNIGMTAYEELTSDEEVLDANKASRKQLNYIFQLTKENTLTPENMKELMYSKFKIDSTKELTKDQASTLIEMLQEMKEN